MLDRTNDGESAIPGGHLREALRRARAEAAEQTDVVVDLRHAEIARLELLREELEPIFAQVPHEIDIFDLGLTAGERPRLFVDMVSFVEMGRDRRTYRFLRDGRNGRFAIAESERIDPIVDAVTAYVARRLIERERLLADEDRLAGLGAPGFAAPAAEAPSNKTHEAAPHRPLSAAAAAVVGERPAIAETAPAEPAPAAAGTVAPAALPPRRRGGLIWVLKLLLAFAVGAAIGGVVVVAIIFAVAKGFIPL